MRYSGRTQIGLLILAVLLSALALLVFRESSPAHDWSCYPVNPSSRLPPQQPACFMASISRDNLVTLKWRVTPAARAVYIYDDTAPEYRDIGSAPAVCAKGPADGCRVQFRVGHGGYFRWVLRVIGKGGNVTHVSTSLRVKAPFPPVEVRSNEFVDALSPQPRRFNWVVDPRNAFPDDISRAWIEVKEPGKLTWNSRHFPRTGPEAVYVARRSALSNPGTVVFQVRDCHLPKGSKRKFCSKPFPVAFRVDHDRFLSQHNLHVESGSDLTLAFTTRSGNLRMLTSETLLDPDLDLPLVVTTESAYVIDSARLKPGRHRIELVSCKYPQWHCSNQAKVEPAAMDGTLVHLPEGEYRQDDVLAVVISEDYRQIQTIRAPAAGHVFFLVEDANQEVRAGDPVAILITRGRDVLDIEVDSPVAWETDRDYTLDFQPAETFATLGAGQALDIMFDDKGGIWQTNEFSNNVEHVTPQGRVATLNLPLGRNPESTPASNSVVTPFTMWRGEGRENLVSISSLAEHISQSGSTIWMTQGGGLVLSESPLGRNHSRVVSFDRSARDLPQTEYDDRFCVYNVPADDREGHGNNQVIGLTESSGRIWIAESRGILADTPSYISSFIADAAHCENVLNFDDPDALRHQSLQYCGVGRTPEQDGCLERTEISGYSRPVKVAHLEADPDGGVVWFNDACGKCIGKLDPNNDGKVTMYEIGDKHDHNLDGMPGVGGFPWNLEVDHEAVYTGEYATRHILRLDKATGTYSEVRVPFDNADVRLHSLAIDRLRERLWFTLTNETPAPLNPAASTIGYIDLASWRSHVEDPERHETIRGVIYRGLDAIPPEDGSSHHQAFRGIAVDPKTGRLALATMWREQITVLTPLPGFWP